MTKTVKPLTWEQRTENAQEIKRQYMELELAKTKGRASEPWRQHVLPNGEFSPFPLTGRRQWWGGI